MKINIYQINHERDTHRVAFVDTKYLEKAQGNSAINSKIYDKVFSGNVDCKTLDDVYSRFNTDHPTGYRGRSLSISDVVEVLEDESLEKGFYFCNTYDFKKVDFEPSKTQDTVSKNMITVLYIQANHYPKAVAIDNSLEAMQKLVGGNIEEYMPFEDEVAIICNEEGKMNGLPLNRAVYDEKTKEIIDIIAGDFFIAYAPIDFEKFKDLPKDLEQKYREKFKFPERFYKQNGKIKAYQYKPKELDTIR